MTANLASSLLISIYFLLKILSFQTWSRHLPPLRYGRWLLMHIFKVERNISSAQKSSEIKYNWKAPRLIRMWFCMHMSGFLQKQKTKKQSRKNPCLKTKNQCIFSRPRVLNATFFLWGADRTENPWLAEMQIRNA